MSNAFRYFAAVISIIGLSAGCSDSTAPSLPPTGGGSGGMTGSVTGGITGATTGTYPDTWQPPYDANQGQKCQPGQSFCQNNVLFNCEPSGMNWLQTNCPSGCIQVPGNNGQTASKCKGDCPAGYQVCENTKQLKYCDPQGYYQLKQCQGQCQNNQCTEDQPLCTPNQKFCNADGMHIMLCDQTGKSAGAVSKCDFGCDPQTVTCKTAACQQGELRCSPTQPLFVEACKPDMSGWQIATTPCKFKCENGKCTQPVCTAGQKKCGADGVMVCSNEQNDFVLEQPCTAGCIVNASTGQPQCALCAQGDKSCENYSVVICNNPAIGWEEQKYCDTPTTCADGKCVDMAYLSDDKTKKQNMVEVLKYMSLCWDAKSDGGCKGFHTKNLTYTITKNDLKDFVCEDQGAKAEFPNDHVFDNADDILGCGGSNVDDLTFNVNGILPGQDGQQCIGFCAGCNSLLLGDFNGKEIIVDTCAKL